MPTWVVTSKLLWFILIDLDWSWFVLTLFRLWTKKLIDYSTFVLWRFAATSSVLGHDKGFGRAHGTLFFALSDWRKVLQHSWVSESCRVMFRCLNVPFRSFHLFSLGWFCLWKLFYGPIAITSNLVWPEWSWAIDALFVRSDPNGWRDPDGGTLQLKWPWIQFHDILRFCQIQPIQWVLGFPDFNGCFKSRSHLQSFLDLQEPEFRTCLCHVFVEAGHFGVHPCLWHLQRGLFLDTGEPMRRMRDRLQWHFFNSAVDGSNSQEECAAICAFICAFISSISGP